MSKKPRTLWRLCRYLWQHKWLLLMALVLLCTGILNKFGGEDDGGVVV